tara:strand:- start:2886 stop:3098 length:213 start_codon:yes stop_codon:yes gene_type:complete
MSHSSSKGVITDAVKQLRASWARCKSSWTDQNAERFEDEYIARLDQPVRQACEAIDRLQSACDEARRAGE